MKKKVSLIIANWNTKELLERNLPAVVCASEKLKEQLEEIIVVDDGSTDDSIFFIKENFPLITVYPLKKNHGFHRAVNYGVEKSSGEIILLLNSDIEPDPDAIPPLIKHFDTK